MEVEDVSRCMNKSVRYRNARHFIDGEYLFTAYTIRKSRNCYVYVLTNYNTTFEEDYRRIQLIKECGLAPDVRIYRKETAPRITKDLQRWCNNRFIYRSVPDFMDYVPRADGKTIKEIYFKKDGVDNGRF